MILLILSMLLSFCDVSALDRIPSSSRASSAHNGRVTLHQSLDGDHSHPHLTPPHLGRITPPRNHGEVVAHSLFHTPVDSLNATPERRVRFALPLDNAPKDFALPPPATASIHTKENSGGYSNPLAEEPIRRIMVQPGGGIVIPNEEEAHLEESLMCLEGYRRTAVISGILTSMSLPLAMMGAWYSQDNYLRICLSTVCVLNALHLLCSYGRTVMTDSETTFSKILQGGLFFTESFAIAGQGASIYLSPNRLDPLILAPTGLCLLALTILCIQCCLS